LTAVALSLCIAAILILLMPQLRQMPEKST